MIQYFIKALLFDIRVHKNVHNIFSEKSFGKLIE
jgi:hypothetical protein